MFFLYLLEGEDGVYGSPPWHKAKLHGVDLHGLP